MQKHRWLFFTISSLFLSIFIFLLAFYNISFLVISLIIFVVGFFFGICSNLIDSFFFYRIGNENKKEYGASVYGLLSNIVVFIMMSITSYVNHKLGYISLMYLFGIFIFITSFSIYFYKLRDI